MKRSFSIATLLATVSFFAVAFLLVDYCSVSSRYQRNHDVGTLRSLLSTRLSHGDSLPSVQSLLGQGEVVDGEHLERMMKWQAGPLFTPGVMPDGFQENDTFIRYRAEPDHPYLLHFRNGTLVNYDQTWFIGPDDRMSGLAD